MQRIALLVIFSGFCFAYLTIPFAGIDLLIDAVGFLVVFNGLRFLGKLYQPHFRGGKLASLVLVVVSALQLFLKEGLAAGTLAYVRAGMEVLLYFYLLLAFWAVLGQIGRPRLRGALAAVLGLAIAATGLAAAGRFGGGALETITGWVLFGCQLLVLAGLLGLALLRWPVPQAAAKPAQPPAPHPSPDGGGEG